MANVPPPPSLPPPGRYRHFKGGRYVVIGAGRHSETEEWLVIYRSERNGGVWLRPLASWNEPADRNGRPVARFVPEVAAAAGADTDSVDTAGAPGREPFPDREPKKGIER